MRLPASSGHFRLITEPRRLTRRYVGSAILTLSLALQLSGWKSCASEWQTVPSEIRKVGVQSGPPTIRAFRSSRLTTCIKVERQVHVHCLETLA